MSDSAGLHGVPAPAVPAVPVAAGHLQAAAPETRLVVQLGMVIVAVSASATADVVVVSTYTLADAAADTVTHPLAHTVTHTAARTAAHTVAHLWLIRRLVLWLVRWKPELLLYLSGIPTCSVNPMSLSSSKTLGISVYPLHLSGIYARSIN